MSFSLSGGVFKLKIFKIRIIEDTMIIDILIFYRSLQSEHYQGILMALEEYYCFQELRISLGLSESLVNISVSVVYDFQVIVSIGKVK